LGAAGYFLFTIEQNISTRRAQVRTFDLHARETATMLADIRAAEQAYVAAGQSATFWIPKVDALQTESARQLDGLRESAVSPAARTQLMEAAAAVTEFGNVDKRAREYLQSEQPLMAGDVVFTEGADAAASAGRHVEEARLAEHQSFDADEARLRWREAAVAGGAALFAAVVVAILAFAAPRRAEDDVKPAAGANRATEGARGSATPATGELMLRQPSPDDRAAAEQSAASSSMARGSVPMLKAAAELCTEFGRVKDAADIPGLLARAADVMDATGVVVWVGSAEGADLQPVAAHGYPDHVLARMPNVPRSADNAAAAAYRTGKLQIVLRRPGGSNGAVVAPLLAPGGCVGALTAEILAGSETTEGVQAVATLFAAQLTGVVSSFGAVPARSPVERSAGRAM
jgi:hypothetical protein